MIRIKFCKPSRLSLFSLRMACSIPITQSRLFESRMDVIRAFITPINESISKSLVGTDWYNDLLCLEKNISKVDKNLRV